MRTFRFRAQAALDLRRREHESAQRALARARSALDRARGAWSESARAVEIAQAEAGQALTTRTDSVRMSWYRSWIASLEHQRSAAAHAVSVSEAELASAAAAWQRTRQRVEALERFAEKARDAWSRAALAEEQKQMDMLATLRFAARHHGLRMTGVD